jgi:hypothetical protein
VSGVPDLPEEHVREVGVERPLVTELRRAVARPPTDVVAVVKVKQQGRRVKRLVAGEGGRVALHRRSPVREAAWRTGGNGRWDWEPAGTR